MEPSLLTTGSLCRKRHAEEIISDSFPKKARRTLLRGESSTAAIALRSVTTEERSSQTPSQRLITLIQADALPITAMYQQLAILIQGGDFEGVINLLANSQLAFESLKVHRLRYLHLALHAKKPQIACVLASQHSLMAMTNEGQNVLYLASQSGDIELLHFLLHSLPACMEVLKEIKDRDGCTPLLAACKNGQLKSVALLRMYNASITVVDNRGRNSLHLACLSGNAELVALLLDTAPGLAGREDNSEHTPLYIALDHGHKDIANLLIQKGDSVDKLTESGHSMLWLACKAKNVKLVTELLDTYKCSLPQECLSPNHPLYITCEEGSPEVLEALLARGVSLHSRGDDTISALQIACSTQNKEVVLALIKKGARPSPAREVELFLATLISSDAPSLSSALAKLSPSLQRAWFFHSLSLSGTEPQPLWSLFDRPSWRAFTNLHTPLAHIFERYEQANSGDSFPHWLTTHWKTHLEHALEPFDARLLKSLHHSLIFFSPKAQADNALKAALKSHNITPTQVITSLGLNAIPSLITLNFAYYAFIKRHDIDVVTKPTLHVQFFQSYITNLNVSKPEAPGYIPPHRLFFEKTSVTKAQLKGNVTKQLKYIATQRKYTGTPSSRSERAIFYNRIERQLRAALDAVESEADPLLLAQKQAKCAIVLGMAGFDCAAQLKNAARDLYFEFVLRKSMSIKEAIDQQLSLLSELVLREMMPDDDVHTFHNYHDALYKHRPVPETPFNDPIEVYLPSTSQLIRQFDNRMTPQRVFDWLRDAITHNNDGIRDYYEELAFAHLLECKADDIGATFAQLLATKCTSEGHTSIWKQKSYTPEKRKALEEIGIVIGPSYAESIETWKKQQLCVVEHEWNKLTQLTSIENGQLVRRGRTEEELTNALQNAELLLPNTTARESAEQWRAAKLKEVEERIGEFQGIINSFKEEPDIKLLAALRKAGMSSISSPHFNTAFHEAAFRLVRTHYIYHPDHTLNPELLLMVLHTYFGLFKANY